MADILEHLNPQQREAVATTEGPVLIIAGAGTGKTRVITHKIAYLINEKHVRPSEIFAATFTNKAAEEMYHRVASLLGNEKSLPLRIATFHSHCAAILRRYAPRLNLDQTFTIFDESDQISVIKQCLKDMGIEVEKSKTARAQWIISNAKMRLLKPDEIEEEFPDEGDIPYIEVYSRYQKYLRNNNALDFDDLIFCTIELFRTHDDVLTHYQQRYRYVLIDEYQDTNHSQFILVKNLAAHHGNISAVGDEDQSIYSWRGADISNLLEFQKHFPSTKLIRLEQNYRSTGNILAAASGLIQYNTQRLGKTLWTKDAEGESVYLLRNPGDFEEAHTIILILTKLHHTKKIPYNKMAIFYRQNSLSRNFEDVLRSFNIPYKVIGGIRFYDREEIKDMLAYLSCVENPHNSFHLARIINKPRRGIGSRTVQKGLDFANQREVSLFAALRDMCDQELVRGKTADSVIHVASLFDKWHQDAAKKQPSDILKMILRETDYLNSLGKPTDLQARIKRENVSELVSAIMQFEELSPKATLSDYLEMVTLTASTDDLSEADQSVRLMTVHCAKGLEFDVVCVVALEEPLFPNQRSVNESGDNEEERRLFYVAMTRAKKTLFLSYADSRRLFGQTKYNARSVFLYELPKEQVCDITSEDIDDVINGTLDKPSETSDEEPCEMLRDGMRVHHNIFGTGIIEKITGSEGHQRLTIKFNNGRKRTLMAQYADLEVV